VLAPGLFVQHGQRGPLPEGAKAEVVAVIEARADPVAVQQCVEADGAGEHEPTHHAGPQAPGPQPAEQPLGLGDIPGEQLFEEYGEFIDQ